MAFSLPSGQYISGLEYFQLRLFIHFFKMKKAVQFKDLWIWVQHNDLKVLLSAPGEHVSHN